MINTLTEIKSHGSAANHTTYTIAVPLYLVRSLPPAAYLEAMGTWVDDVNEDSGVARCDQVWPLQLDNTHKYDKINHENKHARKTQNDV